MHYDNFDCSWRAELPKPVQWHFQNPGGSTFTAFAIKTSWFVRQAFARAFVIKVFSSRYVQVGVENLEIRNGVRKCL